jgi:peptidoglycan/xylan/chitin deacetylase (PgdA/CDA1 family)
MRSIPILLYHSVGNDTSGPLAPYTTSPAAFRDQMAWIVNEGYTTLTVAQYASMLLGHQPLPENPLLITFDDGLADFLDNALPMLSSYGHASTMFVTTGVTWHTRPRTLGGRTTLSWSQVAALPNSGVEVGAHSHDHLQLDLLPAPRVASQLRVCKDKLEQNLQREVTSFAYPHGYNRAVTRLLVQRAGFSSACAVKNQLSHRDDHQWALARIMLTADQSVPFLRHALNDAGLPLARKREDIQTTVWRATRLLRTRGRPLITATYG